jgi:ankyrin repeat protein
MREAAMYSNSNEMGSIREAASSAAALLRHSWHALAIAGWLVAVLLLPVLLAKGPSWFDRAGGKPTGEELLLIGIKANERSWVDEALKLEVGVNGRDRLNMTPLMWAVQGDDQLLVQKLLRRGADVAAISEYGQTPLGYAAGAGQVEMVQLLLEAGADVAHVDPVSGHTVLHFAAARCQAQVIGTLVQSGADVNARDLQGRTPLIVACFQLNGGIDTVQELYLWCADVNAVDNQGRTALMYAAADGAAELVAALLSTGADASMMDEDRHTARTHALKHKHPHLLNHLR